MQNQRWDDIHSSYTEKDWINRPSIFAEQVFEHLPKTGTLLDLGAGLGQDSRYFASRGFRVVSTDNGDKALTENKTRSKNVPNVSVESLDLEERFPFPNAKFDVVYAHLSLHYFSDRKTQEILKEISRVLRPDWIFAFFTNSTDDPEFDTGKEIEPYYFEVEGLNKRYLNPQEARRFAESAGFVEILCDNEGETYKDAAKGIHNLIRYVGHKT